MANLLIKDGAEATRYMKASGSGTDGDPYIVRHDFAGTTPALYNVTLTLANTEYSQALPANCRSFEFQARTDVALRFAFETGKVAGPTAPYGTLKAGDYYFTFLISPGDSVTTLYLAAAVGGIEVEIITWT